MCVCVLAILLDWTRLDSCYLGSHQFGNLVFPFFSSPASIIDNGYMATTIDGPYGPYGPPPPGGPYGGPYAHHRGPPPPPGYFAHPGHSGRPGGPPPHLPRFNMPTPNTSWEEPSSSSTQPTHAPRPPKDRKTDAVGDDKGSSSDKDQATPTQTDAGVTLSSSSSKKKSGPQGQNKSSTDANIVSPPKSHQEEHDTSKVAAEQGDSGGGVGESRSAGIKMVASTVSASSSRDETEKGGVSSKESSPTRPAITAPSWGGYPGYPPYGGAPYWPPGDSFRQPGHGGDAGNNNVQLPYRQPSQYYKLPPSSPVRRSDSNEEVTSEQPPAASEDDRGAASARSMASPTNVIPHRTRSKPSPTVSRSFSSDHGDYSHPPSQYSYGPGGVPPPSPIRSSGQQRYAAGGGREGRRGSGSGGGGGSVPPTPRTPRTPSRHEAPYEGPYLDTVNSASWGYSSEFGPPPSGGPGYPQTPTSSFPVPGEEGYSSYYASPSGYEYSGRPPIGPSASYESTQSSSGQPRSYAYDHPGAYHHPGGPYATPVYSRDEDDPAYLLRDYDPNQDARAIYPSGSYEDYGGPTSQIVLPKKNRKAAKTTAPLDPNDPSITTGVSILTGNTHVPPPESASEVSFNIHKPPSKPVVKEGTRPVCNSISELNTHDVLLGRGGGTNTQVGNRRFRGLVTDFQPTYLMAKRKEKPLLARSIVLIIRKRGGRFVKKDDKSGRFFEVGDEKAEAKTSQALREGLDVRATKSAANALIKQEKEEKKRRKAAAAAARRSSKRRQEEETYYESPARYSREGPPTPYYSHYSYSQTPGGGYEYPSPQYQQSQQHYGKVPASSSSSYDRGDDRGSKRSREYYDREYNHQERSRHAYRGHEREDRSSRYSTYPPSDSYYGSSGGGGPPIPNSPSEEDKALMVEFAPPAPKMSRTHKTESPPAGGHYHQHGQHDAPTPKRGHRSSTSGDAGTSPADAHS